MKSLFWAKLDCEPVVVGWVVAEERVWFTLLLEEEVGGQLEEKAEDIF